MSRPLIGAVACAIAVAGTFTACDRGGANEPEEATPVIACDLTTTEEVETALGADVRPPDATDDGGADALAGRSGCAWATTDGRSAALFELVRTDDMSSAVRRTGFSASARFNAARSRHRDAPSEDIGDRSFWVDEAATLYVLLDASYLVIEVATSDPPSARTLARRLAEPAVARLAAVSGQTDQSE